MQNKKKIFLSLLIALIGGTILWFFSGIASFIELAGDMAFMLHISFGVVGAGVSGMLAYYFLTKAQEE